MAVSCVARQLGWISQGRPHLLTAQSCFLREAWCFAGGGLSWPSGPRVQTPCPGQAVAYHLPTTHGLSALLCQVSVDVSAEPLPRECRPLLGQPRTLSPSLSGMSLLSAGFFSGNWDTPRRTGIASCRLPVGLAVCRGDKAQGDADLGILG